MSTLWVHNPAVDTIDFEDELKGDEVVAEGGRPAFGAAEGAMEAVGLGVRHDVIDGPGDGENALIVEEGSESPGVVFRQGGGAAIDFVVFFVAVDSAHLFGRILSGVPDPFQGFGEEPGGPGFVE